MTNLVKIADGILEKNSNSDGVVDPASIKDLTLIIDYAETVGEDINLGQAIRIRRAMNAWITIVAEGRANQDRRYRIIVEPLQG